MKQVTFSQTDRMYAYNELKQDLIFQKIPESELPRIIETALAVGYENGLKYRQQDIQDAIAAADIKVLFSDKSGLFFKTRYRAQMELSKTKRQITIYNQSIADLHKEVPEMAQEAIVRMHLAHEFFHFLEHDDNQAVNEIVGPITYKEGFLTHRSTITKTSEIGAHMFAKTALGLSEFPTYYDFRYLVATNKMTAKELDDYLAGLMTELQAIERK